MSLSALLERVEGATGPDWELDRLIALAVSGATEDRDEVGVLRGYHRDGFWVSIGLIEPVTASVDAALALIGRVLPGCSWKLEARWARIYTVDDAYSGSAPTPALALCAALLAAKVQQEKTDG